MPLEKLDGGRWPHPTRLPLGAGWQGHCTAPGHEGELPPHDVLEEFCNLGYATTCAWVPRERAFDAVRFAVTAPSEDDQGRAPKAENHDARPTIRVCYVCERNHRPSEQGYLEFDLRRCVWQRRHDDPRLQKMAECFLESYLKKRS